MIGSAMVPRFKVERSMLDLVFCLGSKAASHEPSVRSSERRGKRSGWECERLASRQRFMASILVHSLEVPPTERVPTSMKWFMVPMHVREQMVAFSAPRDETPNECRGSTRSSRKTPSTALGIRWDR
jgi:hypothetical protein